MPFSRAIAAETNGSLPTISKPKTLARLATSRPMRPRPRMPSVLPRSSAPCRFFFSHLPACVVELAAGSFVPAPAGAAHHAQFRRVFHERVVHLHGTAHHQGVGIGQGSRQTIRQ